MGLGHGFLLGSGLLFLNKLVRLHFFSFRLVRGFIRDLNLGGNGANAQKASLSPLQDFHRYVVPVQAQLLKALC